MKKFNDLICFIGGLCIITFVVCILLAIWGVDGFVNKLGLTSIVLYWVCYLLTPKAGDTYWDD